MANLNVSNANLGVIGGILARRAYDQQQAEDQLDYQIKSFAFQNAQAEMADKNAMAEEARSIMDHEQEKGVDTPDRLVNDSLAMVNLAFKHNKPELAMQYMNQTANMMDNISEQRVRAEQLKTKKLETFQQDLALVTNDDEWHALWSSYLMNNTDADPVLQRKAMEQASKPFDPKYKEFLLRTTMSQLDKAREAETNATTQLRRTQQETELHRQKYIDAQADSARALAEQRRKTGTSSLGKIKSSDVTAMADVIASEYDATQPEDKGRIRTAAQEGEEIARAMVEANPKLSLSQARLVAVNALRTKGKLAGLHPLRGGPGSFERPITPGAADKRRVKGAWYTGAPGSKYEGQKFFYDGTKLISAEDFQALGIPPERSATQDNPDLDIESED